MINFRKLSFFSFNRSTCLFISQTAFVLVSLAYIKERAVETREEGENMLAKRRGDPNGKGAAKNPSGRKKRPKTAKMSERMINEWEFQPNSYSPWKVENLAGRRWKPAEVYQKSAPRNRIPRPRRDLGPVHNPPALTVRGVSLATPATSPLWPRNSPRPRQDASPVSPQRSWPGSPSSACPRPQSHQLISPGGKTP